ncbi:hypothetical protein BH09BAC3_BH09BAC3_16800 [soil metagenome]
MSQFVDSVLRRQPETDELPIAFRDRAATNYRIKSSAKPSSQALPTHQTAHSSQA